MNVLWWLFSCWSNRSELTKPELQWTAFEKLWSRMLINSGWNSFLTPEPLTRCTKHDSKSALMSRLLLLIELIETYTLISSSARSLHCSVKSHLLLAGRHFPSHLNWSGLHWPGGRVGVVPVGTAPTSYDGYIAGHKWQLSWTDKLAGSSNKPNPKLWISLEII